MTRRVPVLDRCRTCRRAIPPKKGPGRPKAYCSEPCAVPAVPIVTWEVKFPGDDMPMCKGCGALRAQPGHYGFCSRQCRVEKAAAYKPFRGFTGASTNGGRQGPEYQAAVAVVRQRALEGEGCFFCRGAFNWALPHNHRAAFTAHHLDRIMDGGSPVCSPDRMAPAHRGCNATDGLLAANHKRQAERHRDTDTTGHPQPTRTVTKPRAARRPRNLIGEDIDDYL